MKQLITFMFPSLQSLISFKEKADLVNCVIIVNIITSEFTASQIELAKQFGAKILNADLEPIL